MTLTHVFTLMLLCTFLCSHSQAQSTTTRGGEPHVVQSVVEDQGAKLDELRVRGQVQHMVVTPKVGVSKSYEIIVNRHGRTTNVGTDGAAGKRVWTLMDF
jgi:hypothetical protein